MMIAAKKRFGWGLGVSFLAHLLLFGLVALFGGRMTAAPATEKEQVFAVEWVDGGGGGGAAEQIEAAAGAPIADSRPDNTAIADSRLAPATQRQNRPASETAANPLHAQTGSTPANGAGGAGSGGGTGGGVGPGSGDGTGPGSGDGPGGTGSGIAEHPTAPPRLTKHVQPAYPEAARRAGQTGKALLRLLVSSAGRVSEVEVVQSSGYAALDDSACEAVERWRFAPAKDGLNRAVACYITVPVAFSLD